MQDIREIIMNCRPMTTMNIQKQNHAHQNPRITAITTNHRQNQLVQTNNDYELRTSASKLTIKTANGVILNE